MEANFCPACGTKREERAAFCHQCGQSFQQLTTAPAGREWIANLLLGFGVVSVATVLIFLAIRQFNPEPTTQTEAHQEPDQLAHLRQKAAGGDPAAMMQLAEEQIQMSAQDRDYLFQAAQTLEALIHAHPDHDYSLRLLGNVYYNLPDPERAVAYYRKYLARNPEDANVRVDLGTQLLALERNEDAILEYKKALEYFPNHYNAYFNLSVVYQQLGQEDQVAFYREKANQVEREFGQRVMAPRVDHPRLPEGAAQNPTAAVAPAGDGRYQELERFFREHQVIGNKMTDFQTENEIAVLWVRQFPMAAMPEVMRTSFEAKIKERLSRVEGVASLEIRDADSRQVLAQYKKP